MRKNNLKLFWLVLLSVFILSCSFETKNTGGISFNMPSRAAGSIGKIAFSVQVIKDGDIIYDGTNSGEKFTIKDIPAGKCVIKISGSDTQFDYNGESEVEIVAGQTVPCEIKLTKTPKSEAGGGSTPDGGGEAGGGGSGGITTLNELSAAIASAKDGDTILVGNIDMTGTYNTISINKDIPAKTITIKAAGSSATFTRKTNGAFFSISKSGVNVTFENIVMDGAYNGGVDPCIDGGAPLINITNGGNILIKNCTLQNNHNNLNGGAIAINNDKNSGYPKITITGTTIQNCYSGATGGGIYITGPHANVTIDGNSVIKNNNASNKAGGLHFNQGSLSIKNSQLIDNMKGNGKDNYWLEQSSTFNGQNVALQTIKSENVKFDGSGNETVIQ